MSVELAKLYAQQFSTNVQLLLQQRLSKLRAAVTEGTGYRGEQVSPVDQIGAVEMQPVNTRFEQKTRTDAPTDRRWVVPFPFDLQQLIDTFDKLRMISDPNSAYVQNAVSAANRKFDDLILDAFFGTAKTGKSGEVNTPFGSGQFVGVNTGGTASGANVAKLKKGFELMLENEVDVDVDPIFCAITAKQNTDLLNEIQIISSDFKQEQKPTVVGGKVMSFLGINFIHIQRLRNGTDDQTGTSRMLPMWAKSGMHLGIWQDTKYDVREAKEFKGNPWEVYLYMMAGATRVEEKKIVRIWAKE